MARNYNRRYPKDYGFIRTTWITIFLYFVVYPAALFYYTSKVFGREKLEKGKRYIFTSNHTSYIDPPLLSFIANHPVAYMAKEELYTHKNPLIRFLVISLGAFSVNREKPESATIKTVIDIARHTKWSLGIFPQGKTNPADAQNFDDIKPGFANIAKLAKMDIVPVAIKGFSGYTWIPFTKHLDLKIGDPISYNLPEEEIVEKWITFMKSEILSE